MGGNQTQIFQQGEPLTNYDIVQKVPQHNLSYLKHKITQKEYLIRQFNINEKLQFNQMIQKLKNRKKMDSQFLTKLQRYSQQLEDNLCSSFYKVYTMWQYPTHNLAHQINQRALQKRRFQENQIFSLIASVIQGMSCLQSYGVKHECLTSNAILFDDIGTVKVTDPLTETSISNFQKVNTNRKVKNIYISPQQCQSLKNQRPTPNRNPFKSDVYVLGIIILECGLLQRMDSIYIDEFQDIDQDQLTKKLSLFGEIYSKDLKLTVETMLTRDPKERMDWTVLKQYIPEKDGSSNKPKQNSQKQGGMKIILGGKNVQKQHYPINAQRVQTLYLQNHQPTSFNHTFGQPIQSINYQPPSNQYSNTYNLNNQPYTNPSLNLNTYSPIPTNTNSYLNTNLNKPSTSLYDNTKPIGYQDRLTDDNLNLGLPTAISKITTTNPLGNNRDSLSSFPLNSQMQYKKDYLSGIDKYQHEPTYGYDSHNIYKTDNLFPSTTNTYKPSTFTSNYQNTYTSGLQNNYVPYSSNSYSSNFSHFDNKNILNKSPLTTNPLSNLQPNKYQQNTIVPTPNISKSNVNPNNDKTQIQSNHSHAPGSPFISNYVKDAMSITYDKNLYASSIINENFLGNGGYEATQNSYARKFEFGNNSRTQNNNGNVKTEEERKGEESYYKPISKGSGYQNENKVNNNNGSSTSNNNALYKPLNNQQSGNKPMNQVSPSLNPNQTTVINQPLSSRKSQQQNYSHSKLASQSHIQHQKNGYTYNSQFNANSPNPVSNYKTQNNNSSSKLSDNKSIQKELEYVIEHFKQGSRYEGTKYQDMRHGQGKFFYQDGGMYQGNWKYNKMDGYGKLYYQSGKIAYEGNWADDQFQGLGKLYNQQPDVLNEPFDCENFDLIDQFWVHYEGNFIQDEKDGEGKMVFSNGEYFIGSFHKDMVDGHGQFHRLNGEIIKGVWQQNQLVQVEQ